MPPEPATQDNCVYRAPIVEAVINFDCELPPGTSLQEMKTAIVEQTSQHYPEIRELRIQQHTLRRDQGQLDHQFADRTGAYQCVAANKEQLIQFRNVGFSFNRLAPYSSFDDYRPEIARTWDIYRSLLKPVVLNRISMRYINRFLVPFTDGQSVDIKDYFTCTPPILPGEGLLFSGVFQTIRLNCPKSGAMAQLTLATENAEPDGLPVVVDIEVAIAKNVPPDDLDCFKEDLDDLRALKNEIYQTTLTLECQNLFLQP